MTSTDIASLAVARASGEAPTEPPRPLMRELPPADHYPVDALGPVLAAAAIGLNDKVQAPIAICGQSVLGAAALAVQAHADVELPFGQSRPTSLFLLTVAGSSERKSTADTEALWPVRQHENNLRDTHDAERLSHLNDRRAWEKARDESVKKGKGDRTAIKCALDALGPPPETPLSPMLTCPEPTFEGLSKFFATDGRPSLGVFSAEGGQFIGGHGMAPDAKARTAAGLSEVWDGLPIRRLRAGDGANFLPGCRLSIHLMAQPDIATVMLSDRQLLDQGLLSRIAITAPDTLAGTRLDHKVAPASDAAIKRYGASVLGILEAPLPIKPGKTKELAPRVLPLSADAKRVWWQFADHIERQMAPGRDLADMRGLAGKMGEHAARIAAVLAMVEDVGTTEVGEAFITAGIELAEHYLGESLRLHGASRTNPEVRQAQTLLTWLQTTWPEPMVSLPDIYQRGPNAIRDKNTAGKLVGVLEDHGWLTRVPGGAVIGGHPRRDVWLIVRA